MFTILLPNINIEKSLFLARKGRKMARKATGLIEKLRILYLKECHLNSYARIRTCSGLSTSFVL